VRGLRLDEGADYRRKPRAPDARDRYACGAGGEGEAFCAAFGGEVTIGSEAKQENVEHNARAVGKYLEVAPSFIGPGAPPSEPMARKYKGSSRVPATEKAHDFWAEPCNRDAAALIEPLVSEFRRSWVSWAGVQFSSLLAELYSDPTTVPRWERGESKEDFKRLAAFKKMCRLVADSIADKESHRQINVAIPKGYRRAASKTEARDQDRRERRDEEHEDLSRLVERTMEGLGAGTSEAVGIVADRNGVSVRKVYEAWAENRTRNAS
jgi:hypothetical protein